jgi:hypothetical protein
MFLIDHDLSAKIGSAFFAIVGLVVEYTKARRVCL